MANIGNIENRGVELALNINAVRRRNIEWDVRAGISTLHNELTSLGGISPFPLGGAGRALVGQQLGVFVSKKIQSIDVANNKVIVADTLTPMGNLFPTLEWNLTNTVTLFKNLRLSALLDAKRGFLVQNSTRYFRETQLTRARERIDVTYLGLRASPPLWQPDARPAGLCDDHGQIGVGEQCHRRLPRTG